MSPFMSYRSPLHRPYRLNTWPRAKKNRHTQQWLFARRTCSISMSKQWLLKQLYACSLFCFRSLHSHKRILASNNVLTKERQPRPHFHLRFGWWPILISICWNDDLSFIVNYLAVLRGFDLVATQSCGSIRHGLLWRFLYILPSHA